MCADPLTHTQNEVSAGTEKSSQPASFKCVYTHTFQICAGAKIDMQIHGCWSQSWRERKSQGQRGGVKTLFSQHFSLSIESLTRERTNAKDPSSVARYDLIEEDPYHHIHSAEEKEEMEENAH